MYLDLTFIYFSIISNLDQYPAFSSTTNRLSSFSFPQNLQGAAPQLLMRLLKKHRYFSENNMICLCLVYSPVVLASIVVELLTNTRPGIEGCVFRWAFYKAGAFEIQTPPHSTLGKKARTLKLLSQLTPQLSAAWENGKGIEDEVKLGATCEEKDLS